MLRRTYGILFSTLLFIALISLLSCVTTKPAPGAKVKRTGSRTHVFQSRSRGDTARGSVCRIHVTAVRPGSAAEASGRIKEINVLKYALLDPETGSVTFLGSYDPSCASGPIAYRDLLADALENPHPKFSLNVL